MVTPLMAAGVALGVARATLLNRQASCALVLEDDPVGPDSRLAFESFPEEIEEVYTVSPYREIGGDRASQPGFVAYRGGNWGAFNLVLEFQAGMKYTPILSDVTGILDTLDPTTIDRLLIENERKVRWCQAMAFPLARSFGATAARILPQASTGGTGTSAIQASQLGDKLTRHDPPIVLIVFGAWYIIRAYCMGVTVKWRGPWHPVTARPYGGVVSMTFQPIMEQYPDWQTIRNISEKGGFTTNTPELRGVINSPIQAAAEARAFTATRARENLDAAAQLVDLGGLPIPGL